MASRSGDATSASASSSFSSFSTYLHALSHTPYRFATRAVLVFTSYDEMTRLHTRSVSHMRCTLRWYDLVALGVGGMVDASVFITTGRTAHLYAGSAVALSYAIASLCALLSTILRLTTPATRESNTKVKAFFYADVHYIRSADGYFYV
ncbi:hypothetical protein S83_011460 [Arachis hypogaea]